VVGFYDIAYIVSIYIFEQQGEIGSVMSESKSGSAKSEIKSGSAKQQFELKKLELELSRASGSPVNPSVPLSVQSPPFRVEAAIKLIPKFTEHDV